MGKEHEQRSKAGTLLSVATYSPEIVAQNGDEIWINETRGTYTHKRDGKIIATGAVIVRKVTPDR